MSSVQIIGLNDLQADFAKLAKAQSRSVLRKATMAGARVITRAARKRAPKKSGKLRRNIVAAPLKRRDEQGVAVAGMRVRTQGKADSPNNAFHWRFVELGTRYMQAQPFARPGFDESIDEAEAAVRTEVARAIDQLLGGWR